MEKSKTYESFIFRETWWQNIKLYPETKRELIYDALCKYVFEGIEPEFDPMDAISTMIHFILKDIKGDKAKYEEVCSKRSEAGKRGNEVRWHNQSQDIAKIANATNATGCESQKSQDIAKIADNMNNDTMNKEEENEKQKDKSFSFSQKKEKIIFDFSLILLSEGRPNAYKEARDAYEFNDSTGWTTETTKPNGDVTKKKITNPLSWLQGWKRSNEQLFAPADGMVLADILRQSVESIKPENGDIINYFRGFRIEGDEVVAMLFTNQRTLKKFHQIVEGDEKVKQIMFAAIRKRFPNAQTLNYKVC